MVEWRSDLAGTDAPRPRVPHVIHLERGQGSVSNCVALIQQGERTVPVPKAGMHQCNDSGRNVLALHASLELGEHPHRLLAVPRLGVDVPSPTQPAALAIARLNEL